jgi:hypothetical protein
MHLLREVEKFLREHDMPKSRLGRLALNDPRFVDDLRGGSEPKPKTQAKVRKFMTEYPHP